MKQMADRAVPLLTRAGYRVDIDAGLLGGTAYHAALAAAQSQRPAPTPPAGIPRPRHTR